VKANFNANDIHRIERAQKGKVERADAKTRNHRERVNKRGQRGGMHKEGPRGDPAVVRRRNRVNVRFHHN